MTAIHTSSQQLGSVRLHIDVSADAAVCLDLVLEHAGFSCRDVQRVRYGAHASIEMATAADAARVVEVLRQHLGSQLLHTAIRTDDDPPAAG